jgi:hypothetical protein
MLVGRLSSVVTRPGALYPYHPRVALPVVLGIFGVVVGGFPSLH